MSAVSTALGAGVPGLARLALRRAWPPSRIALSALVLAPFVAWSLGADAGVGEALERATGGAEALAELRRHAARQGLWTASLAWILPLFVVHAARAVGRMRGDDLAWRASRPAAPAVHVAAGLAGMLAGLAMALLLAAATVELAAGPARAASDGAGPSTWREVGALPGPDARRIESGTPLRWRVDDPGRGAHAASIEVRVASGGPLVDVAWSAEGRSGVERVRGRRTLDVPLEGGGGPLVIELALRTEDAAVFITGDGPRGPRLWRAVRAGESAAAASLLARSLAAGAAWLALALGFGAWVGAGTAATLTLTLLAAATWSDAPRWIPAAVLPRALDVAGLGRVPAAMTPDELAGVVLATLAGLALAALGLRGWRRPA